MSTRSNVAVALAELALYGVALWASVQMAKTPDQRLQDRLRRYKRTAGLCAWCAYEIGQVGIRAELAYLREVKT